MKKVNAMVKVQEYDRKLADLDKWMARDIEKMGKIEEEIGGTALTLTKKREAAKIHNQLERGYRRMAKSYSKYSKKRKALKRKFAI